MNSFKCKLLIAAAVTALICGTGAARAFAKVTQPYNGASAAMAAEDGADDKVPEGGIPGNGKDDGADVEEEDEAIPDDEKGIEAVVDEEEDEGAPEFGKGIEATVYEASYKFVSDTPDKDLPSEVTDLLPAPKEDLQDEEEVTPDKPASESVKVEGGTWNFTGYTPESVKVNGENVVFTGKWTFTADAPAPKPKYTVTYEFKSGTPEEQLPDEVTALLPGQQGDVEAGTEVEPAKPSETSVVTDKGTWTFQGYTPDKATVNEDTTFVGTWNFAPKPKYNVTYEFKSSDPDKQLPEEVTKLVPASQSEVVEGTKVKPTEPTQTEVVTDEGTWTFDSYNPAEATVDKNTTFVGTWNFAPKPVAKYTVSYKFVSGTDSKELPGEVTALVPEQQNDVVAGSDVTPTEPQKKVVETEDGTWTFKSYDPAQATVNNNTTFTGTWTFAPKSAEETYTVTYAFESGSPDVQLPESVNKLLPPKQTDIKKGTQFHPTGPAVDQVEEADGVWRFGGYDQTDVTVNDNTTITGTWTFFKYYEATYQFKSADSTEIPQSVTELLPPSTKVVDGNYVKAVDPSKKTIEVENGSWTFEGYDQTDVQVKGGNVEFVGTWKFTEKPAEKYTVTYKFASSTQGKDLPEEIDALLPEPLKDVVAGTEVTPTQPAKTTVDTEDGTWTFDGYVPEKATVNENTLFVGSWTFAPKPAPTFNVSYKFVSGTPDVELPAAVTDLLPPAQPDVEEGTEVTPTQPAQTVVETEDGTWTFESYDPASAKIADNTTFTGTWTFKAKEPAQKFKVSYQFVSGTDGKELPLEVTALIPDPETDVVAGTEVTPTQPAKTVVETEDGTWTFEGYDPAKATVNENTAFTGTWTFKAKDNGPVDNGNEAEPNKPVDNKPQPGSDNNEPCCDPVAKPQTPAKKTALPQTGDPLTLGFAGISGLIALGGALFTRRKK